MACSRLSQWPIRMGCQAHQLLCRQSSRVQRFLPSDQSSGQLSQSAVPPPSPESFPVKHPEAAQGQKTSSPRGFPVHPAQSDENGRFADPRRPPAPPYRYLNSSRAVLNADPRGGKSKSAGQNPGRLRLSAKRAVAAVTPLLPAEQEQILLAIVVDIKKLQILDQPGAGDVP